MNETWWFSRIPVCVSFNLTLLQFRLNQDERARGFLSKSVGSRVGEKGQDVTVHHVP